MCARRACACAFACVCVCACACVNVAFVCVRVCVHLYECVCACVITERIRMECVRIALITRQAISLNYASYRLIFVICDTFSSVAGFGSRLVMSLQISSHLGKDTPLNPRSVRSAPKKSVS